MSVLRNSTMITRYALTRYQDGVVLGYALLKAEEFRHYSDMAQQPQGLIRLGAIPHDWYNLKADYQDSHEDTTVFLAD